MPRDFLQLNKLAKAAPSDSVRTVLRALIDEARQQHLRLAALEQATREEDDDEILNLDSEGEEDEEEADEPSA